MTKYIVADDHPLFRAAICMVLRTHSPDLDIVEAEDILSLQKVLSSNHDCNLVLLDLHMPGAYGFGALAFIQGMNPELPVLVVSAHEKPEVMQKSLQYGARGFLPKSSQPEQIIEAIESVLAGKVWLPEGVTENSLEGYDDEKKLMQAMATLTPQQYLVLTMLAQGLLNKQIAYELNVTEATIKAHITAIFRKLGSRSRTQTVLLISKLELEPPQSLGHL